MPQKPNIKKILKKNPKINAKQLKEGLELTEQLRALGLTRRGYRLASPFARKRVHIVEEFDSDPRTVRLHRY